MSDGGYTVLDGTRLRSVDLSLPEPDLAVTGAQLLEFAESKASQSLYGISLPQHIRTAALSSVSASARDEVTFLRTEFTPAQVSGILKDCLTVVADALEDDPLVVSILDGNSLRLYLEDEDDFAMLAENLFTDLDIEDKGKICKSEIKNALVHMGVEMGIPPFSEFPLLNDILKKHGAEGEEELGQSQFAESLQPVLQEIADALAENHFVAVQNIKVYNGSKLRKILADEKHFSSVIEKILLEKPKANDGKGTTEIIRAFLEQKGEELGLPPPSQANEAAVVLLYDTVFSEVEESVTESEDEIGDSLKKILEKLADQLEAIPIYRDLDD